MSKPKPPRPRRYKAYEQYTPPTVIASRIPTTEVLIIAYGDKRHWYKQRKREANALVAAKIRQTTLELLAYL